MNLSKEQLNIIKNYRSLYESNNYTHLTTKQLDFINSTLRKKIYNYFQSIDIFRDVFDKYENVEEDNVDYSNHVTIDEKDKRIVDLNKMLFKRDQYIKELKKQKNVLLSQTCNQDEHYTYIIKNLPEVTYVHYYDDRVEKEKNLDGTAILHLSDLHYGEIVEMGTTMFDCSIAETRLKSIIDQFCDIVQSYDKAVIFVNGDMVNGNIHQDSDRTNEMTMIDTILRLSKILSEHFIRIYECFHGQLDIVFTVGNHSRTLPGEIYYKNKVKENWEYLLGNMVKHNLENTKIYVEVANTPSIVYQVEDLKFAVTHGDCFKSLNNIRVGAAKFQEMNMATIGHFDHLLIGHFHATKIENILHGKLFANGSFKECDEYSTAHLYSICEPEQTCLIVEKNEIKDIIILNANK